MALLCIIDSSLLETSNAKHAVLVWRTIVLHMCAFLLVILVKQCAFESVATGSD